MSEQTPPNEPARDVTGEQAVKPARLQTGETGERASGPAHTHRYSIQGLIAIIKDKSPATVAAPPGGERSGKSGTPSIGAPSKQEPEP